MPYNGIDVSKHNGVVDFKKVKASGKTFVFVRLGWAGYDGKIKANGGLDPKFEANVKAAISAGLNVGVYVYSYCKTAAAGRVAAQETLEIVKPYKLTMPITFDIEDEVNTKISKPVNNEIVKAFLSTIEAAKYYGLLYTYKYYAESYLDMKSLSMYDVWIAQYASACSYKGNYGIWQCKGDVPGFVGSCPGVVGACDINIAYKDYPSIIKKAKLNRL